MKSLLTLRFPTGTVNLLRLGLCIGCALLVLSILGACTSIPQSLLTETSASTFQPTATPIPHVAPLSTSPQVMIPAEPIEKEDLLSKVELPVNGLSVAIEHLSKRINVQPDNIRVLISGQWSNALLDCDLDYSPADLEKLMQSEHIRLELGFEQRSYVYWVFRTGLDEYQAIGCR